MEFGETFDRPMLESLHQRFCDLYFRHTPDDDGGGKGSSGVGSSPKDGGSKKKHKKKKKRKKSKGRNDVDPADRTLGLDDFLVQPEFIHNPLRHRMVAGFEFEGDPVAIDLRAFIRAFCTLAEGAPRLVGVSLVLPFFPPELRHWSLWHSGPLPELYFRGTRSVSICSAQGCVPTIGRGSVEVRHHCGLTQRPLHTMV